MDTTIKNYVVNVEAFSRADVILQEFYHEIEKLRDEPHQAEKDLQIRAGGVPADFIVHRANKSLRFSFEVTERKSSLSCSTPIMQINTGSPPTKSSPNVSRAKAVVPNAKAGGWKTAKRRHMAVRGLSGIISEFGKVRFLAIGFENIESLEVAKWWLKQKVRTEKDVMVTGIIICKYKPRRGLDPFLMRQDKKKVETCGHELAEELNFAFHDITDKTADKPQEPPNNLGSSDSQKDNWVEREQSASEKIMHQILHTVSVADENLKLKAAAAGWTVKPKHHRMRHDTLWTAVERMQWDVFQIDPYKTENHSKMLVVVDPEGYNVSTRIIKTEVKENSLKPSMTLELRKKRLAKEQSNLEYVWGCKQRGISALRKESPLLDTRWSVVKPTGRSTAASLMTFINNKKITAAAEAHTESDSDSSGEDSVPQRSLTRPPIQLTGQSASAAAASFLAEKRPKNNEKPRENNREKTSPSPWGGWVKAHNKRSNTTAQPSGKTPSPRPLLRHRIATEDTKKKQVNSNNPAGDPTPKLEQLLTDFKLSHLLPNFRDKHINDVALLRLKQEDLKELGVPDSDTQTIFLKIQQLRFLGQT